MFKKSINVIGMVSLALILSFGLFVGCNKIKPNDDDKTEAKEMADKAMEYCFSGDRALGDFTHYFGLYESTDEFGNPIPKVDMDAEKEELAKRLAYCYNYEVSDNLQVSDQEAIQTFSNDLIDCIVKGEASKQFLFLDWCLRDAVLLNMQTGVVGSASASNIYYVSQWFDKGLMEKGVYPWQTDLIDAYKTTHDVNW